MRKDIGLIGPALVVFFACCGGTPVEAEKARRRHFRPEGSDRLLLQGSGWKLPRTVPLFELAKSKLQSYVSATPYEGEDDPLFKNKFGDGLKYHDAISFFGSLGYRTGLPGWRLPGILHRAFDRWMDDCPTERVRLYLIGKKPIGSHDLPPPPDPEFFEVRNDLFEAHPLATFDRMQLRAPGPVRRSFPQPYFPTLSRAALSDLAAVRNHRAALPAEVRLAIREALASGKSVREAAEHYGITVRPIQKDKQFKPVIVPTPKPAHPSYRRAILEYAKTVPGLTATDLTERLNLKFGSKLTRSNVRVTAKKLGVQLARGPRNSLWRARRPELLQMLTASAPLTAGEIVDRLAEREIKTTTSQLLKELKRLGLSQYVRNTSYGWRSREAFDQAWPTVRSRLIDDPNITDLAIRDLVRDLGGVTIDINTIAKYIAARPDLPPRTPPKRRREIGLLNFACSQARIRAKRRE
jgi:transposase